MQQPSSAPLRRPVQLHMAGQCATWPCRIGCPGPAAAMPVADVGPSPQLQQALDTKYMHLTPVHITAVIATCHGAPGHGSMCSAPQGKRPVYHSRALDGKQYMQPGQAYPSRPMRSAFQISLLTLVQEGAHDPSPPARPGAHVAATYYPPNLSA